MRNYVIINGVNSLTIQGLAINNLPPITKPMIRTQREEIDGRDGDIVTELGYSAYDKQIEIGLWGNYDINDIIKYFTGEGTIVFSNEEDKYYNFKILDQIDYEKLLKFKTATITLHCQPFKYPLEEEPVEAEIITLTETGENITLEDTEEAPMKIDLKGNTSQNSTTGKNICEISNFSSTTQLGITLTNNGDGSISVSGTATGLCVFRFSKPMSLTNGTTYYINGGYSENISINFRDSGNMQYGTSSTGATSEGNFTPSSNMSNMYLAIRISSGTSANVKLYPMLALTSGGDYEPYTNGASPNPNYPQDIHVVSGDNSINVVGKNLFEPTTKVNGTNIIVANGSVVLNDDEYTLTATGTDCYFGQVLSSGGSYIDNRGKLINVEGMSEITFTITNASFNNNFITAYNSSKVSLGYTQFNSNIGTYTIPSNAKYITIRFGLTAVAGNSYSTKVQIEKGSTPSEYEKHIGNTYPVNLPVENLWSLSNTYASTSANQWVLTDTAFHLSKGTYTISFDATVNKTVQFNFKDGNNVAHQVNVGTNGTFTTDVDLEKVAIYISSANNTISNIQLEKGSKANSYTPYGTTPIELCKIGNYQDYIYKDSGKWYIEKQIGKVVLDGSETISSYGATSLSGSYQATFEITTKATSTDKIVLSDFFTSALLSDRTTKTNIIYTYTDGLLRIATNLTTTMADFKTWLSTHNTTLYYVLATPTYTEITYQPLIDQLNLLEQAQSKDNQTNISQVNNDLPFELDVSVTFVVPMEINNIGNIYAKPILTIEGTGNIGVVLNDIQILEIDLTNNGKIAIDVTKLEAYNPDNNTLLNRLVTGDYMKLLINEGENTIKLTGNVSSATLTNYIRWI